MDNKDLDLVNTCYEALLDLKCIFPSWSDLQSNFHYHWKQILNSSTNFKDPDDKVLTTYFSILQPLMKHEPGGMESNTALELVRNLDNYRKQEDKDFEPYLLEEVLNRDASSIKVPQKPLKPTQIKKKITLKPTPKIILNEELGSTHSYGTRRSKMLSEGDSDPDGKSHSGFGIGKHLKKGISSDYVWEFTDNDLKDDFYD